MDNGQSKSNILREKSYGFALRIVNVYKHLAADSREYVLSKQLLRSGTSIGANIAESTQAQSRPDFISKLSIALKEPVETEYWLCLLRDAKYLATEQAESLLIDCREIIRILTASIRTSKGV
jgi:four helix bundle protein